MSISLKKLEKTILFIYLNIILIVYPLLNIIYKNNPLIQNVNRIILVAVTTVTLLLFFKKAFGKGLRNIDCLIIIVSLYIFTSLLLYFSYGSISSSDMLKEFLYSVLPFLVYFVGIYVGSKYQDYAIKIIMFNLFLVAIMGMIIYFNINTLLLRSMFNILKEENRFFWQFGSIYGVIIMGYLSQLMYALILFNKYKGKHEKFLLILFFVISILTLQRSAFIGIIMSTLIFIIFPSTNHIKKSARETIKLLSVVIIGLFLLLNVIDGLEILNYNLSHQITSKFTDIKLDSVVSDRSNQAIIFNNNSFGKILFGEGFGKYSPNNSVATVVQPDASYYRIYNELGLIGFIFFFSIFIYFIFKAFKKKDAFMIYFISFTLIAFYFNRVVWAIPCNYIIFIMLGFSESDRFNYLYKVKVE